MKVESEKVKVAGSRKLTAEEGKVYAESRKVFEYTSLTSRKGAKTPRKIYNKEVITIRLKSALRKHPSKIRVPLAG